MVYKMDIGGLWLVGNFKGDFGGMPFTLEYKGVVSTDQIKLTADFMGMPFEFVVKKAN